MEVKRIMLSGDQGAGKSTAAKYAEDWLLWNRLGPSKVLKLADPLYQSLAMFTRERHRQFLQDYGQLVRRNFGEDCLVKSLFLRESDAVAAGAKVVICDDLRTPEEHSAVLKHGYTLIRIDADIVVREKRCHGVWNPVHATEGRLGELFHHYRIENNSDDIQPLYTALDCILGDIFKETFYD